MTLSRRDFLKTAAAGAGALALSRRSMSTSIAPGRPNIILILADDLGYECLGCDGGTSYATPRLDELARTGVRFTNCFAQPICAPSRVQIMTGRYNQRNYIGFGRLDKREIAFGNMLRDAGYATCVAGKWQLAGGLEAPHEFGFDEYCLWHMTPGNVGGRYGDPMIWENGKQLEGLKDKYGPDVIEEFVEGFIDRHQGRPFFIYYPIVLPHGPYVPTPDSGVPLLGPDDKGDRKYFKDMVEYMDKVVGRLAEKLDKTGLSENTLLMFTSDNGTGKGLDSTLNDGRVIHGGKSQMTDAGMRAPLIVDWKGKTPVGRVCDDLIDFTDILPTLAEATGAKPPTDRVIDGQSFLPQILGKPGHPREWIFSHYWERGRIRENTREFMRDKRWKLYDNGDLYDVPADPDEKSPLAGERLGPEARAAKSRLEKAFQEMRARDSREPKREPPASMPDVGGED